MGYECRKGGSRRDKHRGEGIDIESMEVFRNTGHCSMCPRNVYDREKKCLTNLPVLCIQHFEDFLAFLTYSGL